MKTEDFHALDQFFHETLAHIAKLRGQQRYEGAERSLCGLRRLVKTVRLQASFHGFLAEIVAPAHWDSMMGGAQ